MKGRVSVTVGHRENPSFLLQLTPFSLHSSPKEEGTDESSEDGDRRQRRVVGKGRKTRHEDAPWARLTFASPPLLWSGLTSLPGRAHSVVTTCHPTECSEERVTGRVTNRCHMIPFLSLSSSVGLPSLLARFAHHSRPSSRYTHFGRE